MKAAILRIWTIAAFFSMLLSSFAACAADSQGHYNGVTLDGDQSCGQFVNAREEGRSGNHIDENKFLAWLDGYLTAYNDLTPDTYDVTGGADADSMLLWLENYCRANPLDNFVSAVQNLIAETYPKRTKKAPPEG